MFYNVQMTGVGGESVPESNQNQLCLMYGVWSQMCDVWSLICVVFSPNCDVWFLICDV